MPANDKGGKDRLIPARRCAEEVDDRDLLLHGVVEPAVIGHVRVGAHEGVLDDFFTIVDLTMGLPLVVIPNTPTLPGEDGAIESSAAICRGLKIPRCGLISGMCSPWNWKPAARASALRTPAFRSESRLTCSKAACRN